MMRDSNSAHIFLRTFDLPDIHFASISGPDAVQNGFSATRVARFEDLDTIALNRWYAQCRQVAASPSSRDCWLEIDGKVYMIWGTTIRKRNDLDEDNAPVERWEFSFDEMKRFSPVC